MKRFTRKKSSVWLRLTPAETDVLASLVEQIAGLLEGEPIMPATDDPFAMWQAEMDQPAALDLDDPVLARLFPDAYADDQNASGEFRRLTQERQRRARLSDAGLVLAALAASGGAERPVEIPFPDAPAWLKTLTSVRLALAVRLGIETEADMHAVDELDATDPRTYVRSIYDWAGYLQEGLLETL